jgi:ribosomal-protein-alanine N-acetyltransferase
MQYLSSFLFTNPSPRYPRPPLDAVLVGKRVLLRVGDPEDWRSWRNIRETSRDFLIPWEPTWPTEALSYDCFCGQLRRHWREWRSGTGYSFQIFLLPDGTDPAQGTRFSAAKNIIGGIALNDVARGIAQRGTLGYWIGQPFARQGYMTEAAQLVCDFAFNDLKLHRVEAACLPSNIPSKSLLRRLAFSEEGVAKDYLKINGKWENHLLWGKIAQE